MSVKILSINSHGFDSRKEKLILISYVLLLLLIFVVFRKLISDLDFYRSLASRWRDPCSWSPSINLISIYAPTALTDRKTFFDSIHEFFIPADGVIIAGDFNCYERDLDKFGGTCSPAKHLSDFRLTFNFVDAFRIFLLAVDLISFLYLIILPLLFRLVIFCLVVFLITIMLISHLF